MDVRDAGRAKLRLSRVVGCLPEKASFSQLAQGGLDPGAGYTVPTTSALLAFISEPSFRRKVARASS
jgi:hypothetical protein